MDLNRAAFEGLASTASTGTVSLSLLNSELTGLGVETTSAYARMNGQAPNDDIVFQGISLNFIGEFF